MSNIRQNLHRPTSGNATVLILGNYRATLPLVETLAERGYKIIVTRGCGRGTAQYSRFVSECWDNPPLKSGKEFYIALAQLLRSRSDISIVLPIWEECLLGIHKYADLLPQDRLYASASRKLVETCLSKSEMISISQRAGVKNAPFEEVTGYEALLGAVNNAGLPLAIRPNASDKLIDGKKIIILRDENDLRSSLPAWPTSHDKLIVQRFVTGPRINVYFAASKGKPIRLLAARINETDKTDGTGLATDGTTIELTDMLAKYCSYLISALDYHGIGAVQFMQDQDTGELSFLEINPRIAGNHAVPEACGLGLGALAIDLHMDIPVSTELFVGEPGKRYVWTMGAISALLDTKNRNFVNRASIFPRLLEILVKAMKADIHLNWRRNDPMPFAALFFRKIPVLSDWLDKRYLGKKRLNTPNSLNEFQLKEEHS